MTRYPDAIPAATERRRDGWYIRVDSPEYPEWSGPFRTKDDAVRALWLTFCVE